MSKIDKLAKKIAAFEKLALYSDREAFLKAIGQQSVEPNYSAAPVEPKEVSTYNPNANVGPVTTPKPKSSLPPVSKEVKSIQEALNFIASELHHSLNIATDGILGPETRKALTWFANTFNFAFKSDKDLFKEVMKKQVELIQSESKDIAKPSLNLDPTKQTV